MNNRLSVAMQAVENATGLAMAYFNDRHTLDVTTKNPQDLVSRADFEVEQLLRAELSKHFPDDAILGEEMGGGFITDGWVIDPIDGTGNYLRGTPLWGIAVAYMSAGLPEIGVVAIRPWATHWPPAPAMACCATASLSCARNRQNTWRKHPLGRRRTGQAATEPSPTRLGAGRLSLRHHRPGLRRTGSNGWVHGEIHQPVGHRCGCGDLPGSRLVVRD